jgi:recombination protein RecT
MSKPKQPAKVKQIKKVLKSPSVQEQFENALGENSGAFVASVIDLYNHDDYLKKCDPNKVVMEALKAATLKLPINKQLGFAYVVPYKKKGVPIPQFQIGYKGYIQLAMRTGQYRYLNADVIYEGEEIEENRLTGNIEITGEKESEKVQGYFAYMELINGFSKTVYMSKEDMKKHGKKYSPSYNYKSSAWQTDFDSMGLKTVIRKLLSKYGIMSTEMITAFSKETNYTPEEEVQQEIDEKANSEVIDIENEEEEGEETKQEEEQEKQEPEGPDFE